VINSAKNAASNLAVKYLARASVAVPFVLAAGFALAGLTVLLSQRFASLTAYWVMAGGLCVAGILAAAFVSAKEHKEEAAEIEAEKSDTSSTVSDAAAEAISQAPIALLGGNFHDPRWTGDGAEHRSRDWAELADGSAPRLDWRAVLANTKHS
jgi:hypothetical protein